MSAQHVSTPSNAADAPPDAVARGPLWTLRTVAALFLALVVVQALSAGQLLEGVESMAAAHGMGALALTVVALVQVIAGVVVWRPGKGPGWIAGLSALVLLATAGQFLAGVTGVLGVHVTLAVVLGASGAWLTAWAFTPRP